MTWKVMSMANARHSGIHGYVSKGFAAVRDAFIESFSRRRELGAACCVYRHGQKVVDLWGGIRNGATGEPWQEKADVLRGTTFSLMLLIVKSKHAWRFDLAQCFCPSTLH